MFIYLFIYLFVYLFIYLFIYLFTWLFICVFAVPGPADWYKVAPQCAGMAQSPIDLDRYSLKSNIWEENLTIDFDNEGGLVAGSFSNNGHAPDLAIDKAFGSATLSGGPVGDSVYQLEQLHFHFGCSSYQGSEHTVHGSSYPVEVFIACFITLKCFVTRGAGA